MVALPSEWSSSAFVKQCSPALLGIGEEVDGAGKFSAADPKQWHTENRNFSISTPCGENAVWCREKETIMMKRTRLPTAVFLLAGMAAAWAQPGWAQLTLTPIGRYESGVFNDGGAVDPGLIITSLPGKEDAWEISIHFIRMNIPTHRTLYPDAILGTSGFETHTLPNRVINPTYPWGELKGTIMPYDKGE